MLRPIYPHPLHAGVHDHGLGRWEEIVGDGRLKLQDKLPSFCPATTTAATKSGPAGEEGSDKGVPKGAEGPLW